MIEQPNNESRRVTVDGIPILSGPPTEGEVRLQEENARSRAEKESDTAYRNRQIALTESGIRLTRANLWITWILAIFTAAGAGAAIYQGVVANRSMRASELAAGAAKSAADTAAQTLQEMRTGQGAQDTHTLAQQAVTQAVQTTALAAAARRSAEAQISAARSTASAAETANESLTDVQGAFLGSASAQQKIEDNKVSALTLDFPWKNIGNTATRNADTRVTWMAFPVETGMPDEFSFPDQSGVESRQAEIGRGMAAHTGMDIPVSIVDAARKKPVRIYAWGWMTYNDVFKGTPKHLSEFCYELSDVKISTEDAASPSAQFTWKLQLCRSHNCYDDECSDYTARTKLH